MYGENQNSICDTSNKKKQHGFKAMEGADSENSFHEWYIQPVCKCLS